MKRILVIVLAALFLMGCVTMPRWEHVDRYVTNGQIINIGQSQEAVEKSLGAPDKAQIVGSTDRDPKAANKKFVMWSYGNNRIVFQDNVVYDIMINTKQ
jgi:PBP1b-binding outer membrane lipoprotein LpoB